MTSYLDALPKNPASAVRGAGITSYAESLNKAGAVAYSPPLQASKPPAQASAPPASKEPFSFDNKAKVAASSASYLDALASSSSIAPTGAGVRGYLDGLPSGAATLAGAGMMTYVNTLKATSVAGGPGVRTYTDALSGGKVATMSTPFSKPTFTIGSVTGRFNLTIDADPALLEKIRQAGNRKVVLKGKITGVSS
jgi:hypothetical protein